MVYGNWLLNVRQDEEKQCFNDYHWRFGHVESLCQNDTKTAEWWSEGAPHEGVSGHHQAFLNWTRFAL